jgi:hypothetical protein
MKPLHGAALAAGAWILLASACVIVPYTPKASAEHSAAQVRAPEQVIVSIGPRRFLDKASESIGSAARRVELVDRLSFRDAAFPEGGWTLQELLGEPARERLSGLGLDYAVLLGPMATETIDSKGAAMLYIGLFGYAKTDERATLSAVVIDLHSSAIIDFIEVKAEGSSGAAGLVYGVIWEPSFDASIMKGMGRHVAGTLVAAKPEGPIRTVVVAAESLADTGARPLRSAP